MTSASTPRTMSQPQAIRELTPAEALSVTGAMSVRPDQIAGLAKLFGSVGGGTATSGLILQPKSLPTPIVAF